jgi:hypothetical protein
VFFHVVEMLKITHVILLYFFKSAYMNIIA